MSCCANYEPARSAMQRSICQKRPIFKIPYFRPSKCRPLESAAGGECPPPSPLPPAATAFQRYDGLKVKNNITPLAKTWGVSIRDVEVCGKKKD